MSGNEELAMNLAEAAEAIHVSIPTMRLLARRVDFPSFQVGNRWIIPVDPFREWLKAQATAVHSEASS